MCRTLQGYEKEVCVERYLRYLKELQHLRYQLTGFNSKLWSKDVSDRDCERPLKYLRYCLKLQEFLLSDSKRCYCFNFQNTLHKPPLKSIQKNYMMNNLLLQRPCPTDFTRKFFDEIISFTYNGAFDYGSRKTNLDLIQKLPSLQEIHMKFGYEVTYDLEKIAEKGTLKEVKLDFNFAAPTFEKILKALEPSKLTHLSLKILIEGDRVLTSIATLLKSMNYLESLRLDISHQRYFSDSSFNEICEQINKLEKLQHLKLAFNAKKEILKEQRLPNFLSRIYPIFTKPIKLKSLHISCDQIDHSEAFSDLIAALQGSLEASLEKLSINIGASSCSLKSHNATADLVRNLSKIKVLKLPCLSVNSNGSLNLILETVLGLKNLEEFTMGEIDEKVDVVTMLNFIDKVLRKRGLRKFNCLLMRTLGQKIHAEIKDLPHYRYNHDFEKFLKANPCLEVANFSCFYQGGLEFTSELERWFGHIYFSVIDLILSFVLRERIRI